jgi:hypothetical protein
MDVQHILSKALEDYDRHASAIRFLLETCSEPEVIRDDSGNNRSKFIFRDRATGDLVLETEIETFAIYSAKYKVWSWAWSHPGLNLVENSLARDILIHALGMEPQLSYIKAIITTSRGKITNPVQLDINLSIGACLIKNYYIFPYIYTIEKDHEICYYTVLLDTDPLKKYVQT